MRKNIILLTSLLVLASCAVKDVATPFMIFTDPVDVSGVLKEADSKITYEVEVDCQDEFRSVPLPAGTLTYIQDGVKKTAEIQGGVLLSGCETEKYITYRRAAKLFYRERNVYAQLYQQTFQQAADTERFLQGRLTTLEKQCTSQWEKIDCSVCAAGGIIAGAGSCIGIANALDQSLGR